MRYKPKFPCQICEKACKWGQQAMACDECESWHHRQRLDMNTIVYQNLVDTSNPWIFCNCGCPTLRLACLTHPAAYNLISPMAMAMKHQACHLREVPVQYRTAKTRHHLTYPQTTEGMSTKTPTFRLLTSTSGACEVRKQNVLPSVR